MTINPFKIFLVGQTLYEEYLLEAEVKSSSINDDKGKLHELLLSKYLHPDGQLPSHFRAESEQAKEKGHAGTPDAVYKRLRDKVGEEAHNQIDAHAKETAKNLIAKLKEENELHKNSLIGDVHWTSNRDRDNAKGDHEKLTGQKDLNSNADLILTLRDASGKITGYRGVSAKYGTNKQPNYKNPGTESLEKMAGLRPGRIAEMMKPHHHYMEKLGYNGTIDQRHAQYKVDNMSLEEMQKSHKEGQAKIRKGEKMKPDESVLHEHVGKFLNAYQASEDKPTFLAAAKERSKEADRSKREHLGMIAKELTRGLIEKTGDDGKGSGDKALRELIKNDVSPKTLIPHYVAHSWVQEDGSSTPVIHHMSDIADEHLDNFKDLHIATDKAGGSVTIRGYHKDTGKLTNVATYGLKTQSGPHKNINGTLTLK
jgi:hypothetical protein